MPHHTSKTLTIVRKHGGKQARQCYRAISGIIKLFVGGTTIEPGYHERI